MPQMNLPTKARLNYILSELPEDVRFKTLVLLYKITKGEEVTKHEEDSLVAPMPLNQKKTVRALIKKAHESSMT